MNDKTKPAAFAPASVADAPAATSAAAAPATPRLGSTAFVQVAPGRELVNCDTGLPFVPGQATEVMVTITTLRRLADGDFMVV